jgi:hypothetical protein
VDLPYEIVLAKKKFLVTKALDFIIKLGISYPTFMTDFTYNKKDIFKPKQATIKIIIRNETMQ